MNPAQHKAIRFACQIMASLKIHPGWKENEIAELIRLQLKQCGAKPAFRIIVASGQRSAKPHGFATGKRIKSGELVIVDFGALYQGFRSDLTRTFVVGKPTKKQAAIIKVVKESQRLAKKAIKADVECRVIDKVARDYIKSQGHGKKFIHTTGHGIGRKVHQGPKLSLKNRRRLRAGQVITIEPGIYIKGWGGVRIEDMVMVTKSGYKELT